MNISIFRLGYVGVLLQAVYQIKAILLLA